MMSSPPPANTLSRPPRAQITSIPGVPWITSPADVPVMVQAIRWTIRCAAWGAAWRDVADVLVANGPAPASAPTLRRINNGFTWRTTGSFRVTASP